MPISGSYTPVFTYGFLALLFLCLQAGCSNDDNSAPPPDGTEDPVDEPEPPAPDGPIYEGVTGDVWIYNTDKIDPGYILVNDASDNRVYLMTKEAEVVYEWDLPSGIGNDAELLDDGRLLVSLNADEPSYDIGGFGGRVQLINPDRSIDWDFDYNSEDYISHHDVELLPNGNVLIMVWEKRTREEAQQAGYDGSPDVELLLPEAIIEVNPATDDIVWEWHSWDHLVQDFDDTKDNYGDISQNPNKIDLNYHDDDRGDLMHGNGFDYDAERDLIFLSVNFYSEVWVIDHSTTTEEAATDTGGNYGKGGDLVYRFGNPTAYKNEVGGRLFYSNHFPNILTQNEVGAGNMLIYMNGNNGSEQSIVYELDLNRDLSLLADSNNEPLIVWEFTDEELYSPLVGGAVRLPNNNILITEGRYGYWEVTSSGEVVWKFEGNKLFWRGYAYEKDHPAIQLLGL